MFEKANVSAVLLIAVLLLALSLYGCSCMREKFNDTTTDNINKILEDVIKKQTEPKDINNYINWKNSEITNKHSCQTVDPSDKVSIKNLINCNDNYHDIHKLSCSTDKLLADDLNQISIDLDKTTDTLENITGTGELYNLALQDNITNFREYEGKLASIVSQQLEKRKTIETFGDVELNLSSDYVSEDEMKFLYPSEVSDFYGKYDISAGQYKLLWNCTLKLNSRELTIYNTHNDIIRGFKVKNAEKTKYLQFPTTTIKLELEQISSINYKVSSTLTKQDSTIRNNLLIAQREFMDGTLQLRDGHFYLFGNDGNHILYGYDKTAILYLKKTL